MAEISRLFAGVCWKKYALRFLQNRNMSSTFREEKAIEELRKNPYYEKYSMKISAFQKFVIFYIKLKYRSLHVV
jgi:hypothetical protein